MNPNNNFSPVNVQKKLKNILNQLEKNGYVKLGKTNNGRNVWIPKNRIGENHRSISTSYIRGSMTPRLVSSTNYRNFIKYSLSTPANLKLLINAHKNWVRLGGTVKPKVVAPRAPNVRPTTRVANVRPTTRSVNLSDPYQVFGASH